MLCLTRKAHQEILISHAGEQLRLVIAEIKGSGVQLQFEGPTSFEIVRDDAKCRSSRDSAGATNEVA
jgi:sRNA-binding carbon storage regulator CsrA